MFGILNRMVNTAIDTVDNVLDDPVGAVTKPVGEFIDNPVKKTIEVTTQPLRDGIDILEGLSEGEIREKAILRLGADVVSGMALGEVISYLKEN